MAKFEKFALTQKWVYNEIYYQRVNGFAREIFI